MEERFEDHGHILQGPHRDLYKLPIPDGFAPLRLELQVTGQYLDLQRPDMVIGRHSEADVRLAYADISRRHCRLAFQDGCWKIFDLNSLNGVYLNGDRVLEAVLHAGDLLRIGDLVFIVQASACVRPHQQNEVLKSIAEVLPAPRKAG